ncbi:MAG TPA: NADPH:quinone oxidoreductase family protein [Candidatus Obscuribacterales bacterium]
MPRLLDAPVGQRVLISELSENPLEAIEAHLSIVAQPVPDPQQLEPGDAIIAVESAAVGWVDLLMTSGQYQHMPPLPYTPGLEYCGEILWTGPDVKGFAAGDRVLVDGFVAGPRSPGAYQQYGGFASYAVAPQVALREIPTGLDLDQACNLFGSYETAYYCLITSGQLCAGETVLILGASGATGLAAVHIAKLLGAQVIATGRSDEKLAVVKAQGADHVINTRDVAEEGGLQAFRDQVRSLTGGRGVDVVYDGVGGDITLAAMRCAAFGARYLIVGWAATPAVARGKGLRGAPNANQLPSNLILMKGLKVLGSPMVIATQRDPGLRPPRVRQLLDWVAEGKLKPFVSHRFGLDQVKAAMQAKWTGQIIGGCVLHPK